MGVRRQEVTDLDDATTLWAELVEAERNYVAARRAVVTLGDGLTDVVHTALDNPAQRGTALRLLLVVDVDRRLPLFPELVRLASVGHSDVGLVREVIRSLPSYWVEANLGAELWPLLDEGGDEEYRRLAELLDDLGSGLLPELVDRARASADPDVREVADDFAHRVDRG
jgi:hypothetical protein